MRINKMLFTLALALCSLTICNAQDVLKNECESDIVATSVVIPIYLAAALATRSQGEVVIEVEISPEGNVTEAKTVSGNKILGGNSIYALKKWKFNSLGNEKKIRKIEITFSYRLIPRGETLTEALTVFKLPFRVEVTEFIPEEYRSF